MALPARVERGQTFDPMDIIRHDLSTLGRFFGGGLFGSPSDTNPMALLSNYGVDIREDDDHIYVEADLPGFRKDEVNITLEDGTLTIVAEHKEEVTEPAGDGRQAAQQGQAPGGQGQTSSQGQPGSSAQSSAQGASGAASAQGNAQSQPTTGQQDRRMQQGRQENQRGGDFLLRERRYERFVRSFTLPPNVDENSVQATLENGVLRITLNKREDAKPRRIDVQ
jgi:HSP20 family molecular chaperone IbpA